MKYSITYFYNVRFFKPNQIPVSTAVWDPKWYHNNTGNQDFCFVDKRGVINGIKEEKLSPSQIDAPCGKDCIYRAEVPNCCFLRDYRNYLQTVDFTYLLNEFNRVAADVFKLTHYEGEPEIVLLVHEKKIILAVNEYLYRTTLRQMGLT